MAVLEGEVAVPAVEVGLYVIDALPTDAPATCINGEQDQSAPNAADETAVPAEESLAEITNGGDVTTNGTDAKTRSPRQPRQRGPPEDGIPSKNKVMVANLPYDLSEEQVCYTLYILHEYL